MITTGTVRLKRVEGRENGEGSMVKSFITSIPRHILIKESKMGGACNTEE
jgi:hypothetical protein